MAGHNGDLFSLSLPQQQQHGFAFLANDLAKEQKLNFGDDIACQLRAARKKRWNVQEEKRIAQEIELQTYLNKLIRQDTDSKIQKLKEQGLSGEEFENLSAEFERACVSSLSKGSPSVEANISHILLFQELHANDLNLIFAKIDDRRRKRDVPDYLCGKISFEILKEPVITPSGITYERKDIEEHLQVHCILDLYKLPLQNYLLALSLKASVRKYILMVSDNSFFTP